MDEKKDTLNSLPCADVKETPQFHIYPVSDDARTLYKDLPTVGSELKVNSRKDAGIDLKFPRPVTFARGETKKIPLDVRVWCSVRDASVPFYIIPRSSIGKTPLLASENVLPLLGRQDGAEIHTIQCALTGESVVACQNPKSIVVEMTNHGTAPYTIEKGISLFQLVDVLLRPPVAIATPTWAPGAPSLGVTPESRMTLLINPLPAAASQYSGSPKIALLPLPADITCAPGAVADVSLGVRMCCKMDDGVCWAYWMVPMFDGTPLVLKNWVGLIDEGYRGELKAKVYNSSKATFVLRKGEQAFGILTPFPKLKSVEIVPAEHSEFALGATVRGDGGFGSTGAGGKV